MKKCLALLMALILILMCSACSREEDKKEKSSSGNNTSPVISENSATSVPQTNQPGSASGIVGNIVTFGSYEQDNNLDNGPEPIEWIVLDVQDGKALLLSRYGLDCVPYNTERVDITWENCSLRAWLNSEFLNKAFSTEEQASILTTEVDNSDTQNLDWTQIMEGWSEKTTGGNNTKDKIFLLSYAEANRYLGASHDDRYNTRASVAPTAFAIRNGAFISEGYELLDGTKVEGDKTSDGKPAGWWWLRSPGNYQRKAELVGCSGWLDSETVSNEFGAVRPAFWLNLESGIF